MSKAKNTKTAKNAKNAKASKAPKGAKNAKAAAPQKEVVKQVPIEEFQLEAQTDEVLRPVVNYGRSIEGKTSKAKNAVRKQDFLKLIQKHSDGVLGSRKEARAAYEAFVHAMHETLLAGHAVPLSTQQVAIGIVHLRPQQAQMRRNMKDGSQIETPARVTARLRCTKKSTDERISTREALTEALGHLLLDDIRVPKVTKASGSDESEG